MTILNLLQLNKPQTQAATDPGNLVVTAGAGSGKTRTLVGRYLSLLESGVPLRGIVAITFTEKAAREMRTRIRQTITEWLVQDPPRRAFWEQAFADLDAARIGTIHSLCAQILREHPVEAARLGFMPRFGVLEEGRAAVMRTHAIEEALAWAADDDAASHLFGALGEFGLRAAVAVLLAKRLDADASFEQLTDDPLHSWSAALTSWLRENLDVPQWRQLLHELSDLQANDPTDKMETARQAVLAHAEAVDDARQQNNFDATLTELAALRASTALGGRKANWPGDTLADVKDVMRALRAHFDDRLKPLADPKKPASWTLDEQVAGIIWSLHATYRRTLDAYAQARRTENALDFDDMEAGALEMLDDPDVRATWQANVQAVLVDEFQDTNERQRQIVYALTGFPPRDTTPASLFVVGDAKQSIYRFRGADVTVFRRVQDDMTSAGGRVIPLDLTFRAHEALIKTTNQLLAPIMGEVERPGRPYAVPFAPLTAFRSDPRPGIAAPFVELLLGLGTSASAGRQAAADGLATRLRELRARENVEWKDVALLFRASTAFGVYEDALERAGIPFVTVSGRGFYERYEVRNLLNALVAIADPTDDLALVGFLRSPSVGLTDAALYLLRFPPPAVVPREKTYKPCSIWAILNHISLPDIVPPDDLARAVQGRDLVRELHEMAGRVPVAALLKQLLDQTHYRAALQTADGGARAQRNVDKLLADAHTSGLVSAREFVEYVHTLRGAGARESEAPTEAGSAVQLMTVHKSKGLEFPVIVIADAAHAGRGRAANLWLDEQLGVTLNLRNRRDDDKRRPAAHQLASLRDIERAEAENHRLLYVAATRAREKLLVSAHTKILKGGRLGTSGWLKLLGQVTGLDDVAIAGTPIGPQELPLTPDVGCTLYPWQEDRPASRRDTTSNHRLPETQDTQPILKDLVAPLVTPLSLGTDPKLEAREVEPPRRVWRIVPLAKRPQAPAWVVGTLTHAALCHWRFERKELDAFLRPFALEMGVVDEKQIHNTILETARNLRRFRAHPLWAELDAAQRWPEVPFSIVEDGQPESGIIDLLYRVGEDWKIAEFKTDQVRSAADLPAHIQKKAYDDQVRRYVRAVRLQLGVEAKANLIFMSVGNQIAVVPVL
ncbi:MAG: UvrD-helicase domain-containing protein [Chloroflexi bacterium]|nr:UvrD-helicase domain-containing protein [Chloroflexota bacterium]